MSDKNSRRSTKQSYAGIPRIVMDSPDYINLSGNAVKLLLELSRQYKGKNNGDLTMADSILKHRGLGKNVVARCKAELLAANLIIQTRTGRFLNPGGVPALFALTWRPIDDCGGKLEVSSTTTPPRKFSIDNNKKPIPKSGQGSSMKTGRQQQRNDKGQFTSSVK